MKDYPRVRVRIPKKYVQHWLGITGPHCHRRRSVLTQVRFNSSADHQLYWYLLIVVILDGQTKRMYV